VSRTFRVALLSILGLLVRAQESKPAEPPEEDPSYKSRTHDFNPLKATQSLSVGDQYFKKGNFAAARGRYQDATLYDPGSAEAFAKLGLVDEKLHDFAAARAAYAKYLILDPNAKDAEAIRRRTAKWSASKPKT
jgi:tetratricopeptide (TPR) repeat protein